MTQRRIPAVFMRGGTSKGVFFHERDLPADPVERDRVLLRVVGSPDPYGKQVDGMGAATSSTSKVVIVAKSARPDSLRAMGCGRRFISSARARLPEVPAAIAIQAWCKLRRRKEGGRQWPAETGPGVQIQPI